ncbi:MAG TPA: arylesterase [Gammaproteobacteria bacterium]|nr:arylesterase [Gammaproteobacteria bacterium]
MSTIKALLVCLVVFLPLPAFAGGSQAPVILVLGDSLSAAHGIPLDSGWVSRLQTGLKREGYHYRVVNASISGDTTRGGLERLPLLLRRYHPAIVVVELGANDGLRGLSLEAMRANLAAIIRASRQGGARILLLGMRLPPNYGNAYTHRFHQVYPDLARRMSVPLVPFLLARLEKGDDLDPALMQEDGIHPNARAQPLVLAVVWAKLVPLLKARATAGGQRATTGGDGG